MHLYKILQDLEHRGLTTLQFIGAAGPSVPGIPPETRVSDLMIQKENNDECWSLDYKVRNNILYQIVTQYITTYPIRSPAYYPAPGSNAPIEYTVARCFLYGPYKIVRALARVR